MKLFTKRNQSGFTIIEVMIVLAIAGVIMLALFLAVPALQRNSRNNQRKSDVAFIAAAMNECLNSRNGVVASCDTLAELTPTFLDVAVATTKLKHLTTVNVSAADPVRPAITDTITANIGFTAKCQPDGSLVDAGGTPREFAVLYNEERAGSNADSISRCVSS